MTLIFDLKLFWSFHQTEKLSSQRYYFLSQLLRPSWNYYWNIENIINAATISWQAYEKKLS